MTNLLAYVGVWISADDQLPDDDIAVLIVQNGEVWSGYRSGGFWCALEGYQLKASGPRRVTHWMHLPEPPK